MDEEAKAELLTFLIVGQLLAYARSGEWMRTDHLIESCQIWLSSNGARCDWLDRAKLIEACRQMSQEVYTLPLPRDEAGLLKLFNLDGGWFLDYRSALVRDIHALSLAHLRAVDRQ
ncbi:conserved hypothetical protein [Paraburkholderia tropica]|uniref:hypothetical protein n=1 Tax=Paraburkholderia tropica TaxID=92647 RepID=UPI001CB3C02B|nr:hypothetical protein [Paraburkholderia tropica]CAG9228358.1 conserved hypothetical protein [Paraburkholderia tropica]